MIKAIILDWGGTITSEPIMSAVSARLSRHLGVSKRQLDDAIAVNNIGYLLGRMDGKTFWNLVMTHLGVQEDLAVVMRTFLETSRPNPDMLALAQRLRRTYKLGLLSDSYPELAAHIKAAYQLPERFDAMVFSNDIGVKKPHKEIYQRMLKELRLSGKECLFIDDQPKNVEGAHKAGLQAIQFRSLEQLKKDLRKLKVKA